MQWYQVVKHFSVPHKKNKQKKDGKKQQAIHPTLIR